MGFFKLGKKKAGDVEMTEKTADAAAPSPQWTPEAPMWPGSLASARGSTADLSNSLGGLNGATYLDVKCEVMAEWLHSKQEEKIWTSGEPGEGVLVKKEKGSYAYSPSHLIEDGSGLYQAVTQLNARVCREPPFAHETYH
jgi:hypothetical protein